MSSLKVIISSLIWFAPHRQSRQVCDTLIMFSSLLNSLAEPWRKKFLLLPYKPRIRAKSTSPREIKLLFDLIKNMTSLLRNHETHNQYYRKVFHILEEIWATERQTHNMWLSHIRSIHKCTIFERRAGQSYIVSCKWEISTTQSTKAAQRERKNHRTREKPVKRTRHTNTQQWASRIELKFFFLKGRENSSCERSSS